MPYFADGAHFYDKEGNPRYDATLREAKKEDLLISVTTYCKMLDKPQLDKWKTDQMMECLHYVMTKAPGSTLKEAAPLALEMFNKKNDAAIKGDAIHKILEMAIKEAVPVNGFREYFLEHADPICQNLYGSVVLAYRWAAENVSSPVVEKTLVSEKYRYAGKQDLGGPCLTPDGRNYKTTTIDWKSQKVKFPGYYKADMNLPITDRRVKASSMKVYPEWKIQIGAYAAVQNSEQGVVGVIGTDPEFPFFKPVYYSQEELIDGFKMFRHLQMVYSLIKDIQVG